MKIISCSYTGNIPGLGRGPINNVKISNGKYKQLCNMGFSLKIATAKAEPKVNITKSMHVPSLEEKRAAILADPSKAQHPAPKPSPLKKVAPKADEKKEETKVEEAKEAPAEIQEAIAEAPVPEVTEAPAESKKLTKENLESLTEEELENIIPKSVKRPIRYGKKWLMKTAADYI